MYVLQTYINAIITVGPLLNFVAMKIIYLVSASK